MHPVHRMPAEPAEDVGEVGPGVDALEHAASDEGEHRRGRVCATLGTSEQPLLPTDDRPTKRELRAVVVHGQLGEIQEPGEELPSVDGVGALFAP